MHKEQYYKERDTQSFDLRFHMECLVHIVHDLSFFAEKFDHSYESKSVHVNVIVLRNTYFVILRILYSLDSFGTLRRCW